MYNDDILFVNLQGDNTAEGFLGFNRLSRRVSFRLTGLEIAVVALDGSILIRESTTYVVDSGPCGVSPTTTDEKGRKTHSED